MKRFAVASILALSTHAALGACFPPPGLSPQQWYAQCGPTMEEGFARGIGGTMSHDQFMTMMYRMYLNPNPGSPNPGAGAGPYSPAPAAGQCQPGTLQCFNGWLRRCEMRGYAAMWITGAQRCSGTWTQ